MAMFALDVQQSIQHFTFTEKNIRVAIRIGLHCGNVVAGIIGERKFAYDLWGDAVNTASRMESHGEAGKIHVSSDFRNAAGNAFTFTERGELEIKGKGKMRTYFLEKQ
jgi:class 3 adenylate cyclase